jgi:hypothetical protein
MWGRARERIKMGDDRFQQLQHAADTFNGLGWFLPAYITGKAIFELVERIDEASTPQARDQVLADGVCELYGPRALAVMQLYRYRTGSFVRDFEPIISECIEASFYGFLRVATTGLAPVIEAIARAIAKDQNINVSGNRRAGHIIREVLDNLGSRAAKAADPSVSGEIALLVHSYRSYFDDRFWARTDRRPSAETLNRHDLLHGITVGEDYGTRYNFSRLVSVLDLFCQLIALVAPPNERLPILAPSETAESLALAAYFGSVGAGRLAARAALLVDPSAAH